MKKIISSAIFGVVIASIYAVTGSAQIGNGIYIEAESAVISLPSFVVSDATARGSAYVFSPSVNIGATVFRFEAPESGNYFIYARILAANSSSDSFFVSVDNGAEDIYDAAEGLWKSVWQWTAVNGRNNTGMPKTLNPRVFLMTSGTHYIKFRAREANSKIDAIFITKTLGSLPDTTPSSPTPPPTLPTPPTVPPTATPPVASAITLVSPNGGEVWYQDQGQYISFISSKRIPNPVDIVLKKNGATSSTVGQLSAINSTGSVKYLWRIRGLTDFGNDFTLCVTDRVNPANTDCSDGTFAVLPVPYVTIESPNGGEKLLKTSTYQIRWRASNIPPAPGNRIQIFLEGESFERVATLADRLNGDALSYNWTVPSRIPEGQYYLTVSYLNASGEEIANDLTDVEFSISESGRILSDVNRILEAENAYVLIPDRIENDPAASGGRYVISSENNRGFDLFMVNVKTAGMYYLWGRVLARNSSEDSFYVSANGSAEDVYDTAEGKWGNEWQWTRVNGRGNTGLPNAISSRPFNLRQGVNIIIFRTRERGSKLDAIYLASNLSSVPDIASPAKSTVTVRSSSLGKITSASAGIDCGSACVSQVDTGSSITFSAVANSGNRLSSWNNPRCLSSSENCAVTVTNNFTLMPSWERVIAPPVQKFTVSVTRNGEGNVTSAPSGINCGNVCSATFDADSVVKITGTPSNRHVFNMWTGDCLGNASCELTVASNKFVTANFKANIETIPARFSVGQRVITLTVVKVRNSTGISGTVIAEQGAGTFGQVLNGPIIADGFRWWQIGYDSGTTGWSADGDGPDNWLNVAAVPPGPNISNIPNVTMNEDGSSLVGFTINDTGVGNAFITIATSSNPELIDTAGMTVSGSLRERNLSLRPRPDKHGTATITVSARNSRGERGYLSFNLTVIPVNDPPILTAIVSPQTVSRGETVTIRLNATDKENDSLTFISPDLPRGATLNPATGIFTWIPNNPGAITLNFAAEDWMSQSLTQTVNLEILEISENQPSHTVKPPANKSNGGRDAIILDWTSINPSVTNYKVMRRLYGQTDENNWATLADVGNNLRYIDDSVNPALTYQYKIVAYENERRVYQDAEVAKVQSANFEVDDAGLTPEKILALISSNAPGLINLSETVAGADTANGKLSPVSEQALLSYLGIGDSDFTDLNSDGIYENSRWLLKKYVDSRGATTKIEAPLGVYYAIRRNIPRKNLLILNEIPTAEFSRMNLNDFDRLVVTPIYDHLKNESLLATITGVVSVFGFPIELDNSMWEPKGMFSYYGPNISWDSQLNFALWRKVTTGTSYSGAMPKTSLSPWTPNIGRKLSRKLGDEGFLAVRIDAPSSGIGKRMIDDSIWAEENYRFYDSAWRATSDLKALLDWRYANPTPTGYERGNIFHIRAANEIYKTGYFGDVSTPELPIMGKLNSITDDVLNYLSNRLIVAPDIRSPFVATHPEYDRNGDGKIDNVFFYAGWYDFPYSYQNIFAFSRGGVSVHLDSYSSDTLRNNASSGWAVSAIKYGAAATLGVMSEPGHYEKTPKPDIFAYYFQKGFTFAEAAYLSGTYTGAPSYYVFNGDPLYKPFPNQTNPRYTTVGANTKLVLSQPYNEDDYSEMSYLETLANGLATKENKQTGAFYHLNDGKSINLGQNDSEIFTGLLSYYNSKSTSEQTGGVVTRELVTINPSATEIRLYDASGRLSDFGLLPRKTAKYIERDEIAFDRNGHPIIARYRRSSPGNPDYLDLNGFLLELDGSRNIVSSSLVIPAFDIRYNLDRTVSQDSSYWRVTNNSYISANVGGSSMRLLSRMNDVLGRFRLEFNYAANTSSVSEARWYDNDLLVGRAVPSPENPAHLRIAFGTSDNAFIVSKAARNAGQLYQLFTTLSETNFVPKMRLMRDIVIDDMASRGIARESAEQRVLFGFDGVTLSPKYMINQTRFANNNNVYILTDINGASKQNYRIETRGRVVGQTIVQYVMITRPDGSTRNLDLTRDQLGAPTVSSVSAMTVYVNETSAPITATITDNDTPPERIRMTAIVNPNIVPRANVVVSGTGLTRTITVRPINTGTVNMFIQVNDGENTAASQTVNLTIRPQ